jgi:hypothetical protein
LPSDFVFSSKKQEKPTDQIGPRTWNHIVGLPDDVAIRTTDHHGTEIKNLNEFQSIWTDLSKPSDMMTTVLLDAHDDFQAALYNAITGYYRLSVTAIRAALEALAIGAWCQTSAKRDDFKKWRRGKTKLEFNSACQGLHATAAPLETYLDAKCGDNLFRARDPKAGINAGFVRRLFADLSEYAHGRPQFTDSSVRRSNGPIYVTKAFDHAASMEIEVFGLSIILLILARPSIKVRSDISHFIEKRVQSEVTKEALRHLRP